jgi:hypothetical protein
MPNPVRAASAASRALPLAVPPGVRPHRATGVANASGSRRAIRPGLHGAGLIILLCGLGGVSACTRTDPPSIVLTPEEQVLLDRLTTDDRMLVTGMARTAQGRLIVITRQGDVSSRYCFAPDSSSNPHLNIHHIDDTAPLIEGGPEQVPSPRGR